MLMFFNGNCYFGDKDGDRIFTNFTGSPITNSRENVIISRNWKVYWNFWQGVLGIAMQLN